ncbi:unnamed protein product, partial [marine sediment metagenome]
LKFKHSGKCLDKDPVIAHFIQYDCHNGRNQKFSVIFDDAGNGIFQLKSEEGKVVTVENANINNGAKLIPTNLTGNNEQLFKLEPDSNGLYTLRSILSNRCIEIGGASKNNLAAANMVF